MNFLGINETELKSKILVDDFAQFEKANSQIIKEALEIECPICRSKLILGNGEKRYETLGDHVCNPNGTPPNRPYFICPNDKCALFNNSFFDDYGEFYSNIGLEEIRKIFNISREDDWNNTSKNCCHAAYNSNARKSWFEIYYKEEFKRYFIGKMGFYFYNKIFADKYGNIIKRKLKIQWLRKEKDGCTVQYVWGSHMFIYELKTCFNSYKQYKKTKNDYYLDDIKKHCDKNNWMNKGEWWRNLGCFINRLFYLRIFEKKQNIFIRMGKAIWFTLINVNGKYKRSHEGK